MIGIYTYSQDCWYGYIEGIFKADSKDVELIEKNHLTFHLCEALGKYSETDIEFKPGMCKLISDNPNEVEILDKLTGFGYNPFYQESFYFEQSDELEKLREEFENADKGYYLEDFIEYLKEKGVYDNLENG